MTSPSGYTPWLDDGDVRIYHGDALQAHRGVVTSDGGGRNNTVNENGTTPSLRPRSLSHRGWEATCDCPPYRFGRDSQTIYAKPVPCVVLDPFMGSATTALVARRLGRHAIGIELNHEYLEIAARRLQQLSLLA